MESKNLKRVILFDIQVKPRSKESKKETKTKRLEIYTDGSCLKNPGSGGWAFLIKRYDHHEPFPSKAETSSNDEATDLKPFAEETGSGGEKTTTNNRMELKAVIECLKSIDSDPCDDITIWVDSKYVKDGITDWIQSWKKNDWKKSNGGAVLNKDLWMELDELVVKKRDFIRWKWVKGHSGQKDNEVVDKLASTAAKNMERQKETDSKV